MTKLLLSVHVLAAILVIGPIAVAASLFPRYARQVADDPGRAAGVATLLYRICRGYTVVGIAVPVFGIATGAQFGVLTDPWLIISLVLTVIAAIILAMGILPGQQRMLGSVPDLAATATRLTMLTGIFNVLWAIVVVLMIVRPGSATGA